MSLLNDYDILKLCYNHDMIEPFETNQVSSIDGEKVISYGVSSYGYDIRVGSTFKVFHNVHSGVIDPKRFDENAFIDVENSEVIIPPNSFLLAQSLEWIKVPRDILVLCIGKSTYARCGLIINVTPLEPEWEGNITIEIGNQTPLPARIYANEGIAQLIFFKGYYAPITSYKDRKGKYQGQTGVTLPK